MTTVPLRACVYEQDRKNDPRFSRDPIANHDPLTIHDNSAKAAEENGLGYNLVAGANIAGFAKVADAMIAQGLI